MENGKGWSPIDTDAIAGLSAGSLPRCTFGPGPPAAPSPPGSFRDVAFAPGVTVHKQARRRAPTRDDSVNPPKRPSTKEHSELEPPHQLWAVPPSSEQPTPLGGDGHSRKAAAAAWHEALLALHHPLTREQGDYLHSHTINLPTDARMDINHTPAHVSGRHRTEGALIT